MRSYRFLAEVTFKRDYVKICDRNNIEILIEAFLFFIVQEFIYYIVDAMHEKVVAMITSKQLMAMLSDGSQTRKTGMKRSYCLFELGIVSFCNM